MGLRALSKMPHDGPRAPPTIGPEHFCDQAPLRLDLRCCLPYNSTRAAGTERPAPLTVVSPAKTALPGALSAIELLAQACDFGARHRRGGCNAASGLACKRPESFEFFGSASRSVLDPASRRGWHAQP